MEVEKLLWRLADEYAPSPALKPDWFDRAGDLVVTGGPVVWETPWHTEGGFQHPLPAGTYPVYVGTSTYTPDDRDPDAFRYTTRMVVIPLAGPERIAEADWEVEGYDDIHMVEDYAVLWGEEAMRATLPHEDGVPAFFPDVRDGIEARGPHLRRDNWAEVVLDRDTGANAFVLPVTAENLTGYEIVDEDENVLCLVLTEVGW